MTPNDYQKAALSTAIYPNQGENYIYPCMGISGESGEIAEKVKKVIRDKEGVLTDTDKEGIAKELGDLCWYVAVLAYELGYDLGDIMQMNLNKLSSRKERGVLSGSGDNR